VATRDSLRRDRTAGVELRDRLGATLATTLLACFWDGRLCRRRRIRSAAAPPYLLALLFAPSALPALFASACSPLPPYCWWAAP
jgi:hypothetical protein